ncbi:hypothetical protein [Kitasatospora sp. P5_F3]
MNAHRTHPVDTGGRLDGTEVPTEEQVRRTSAVITAATWVLTGAVVAASMFTAAPFVDAHSTGYGTGPIMVIGTDGCFILALQADSVLARFGADGGWWTRLFRWATGLSTVWLNIGHSILVKDLVGVAVHLIPPLLLLLVAEAGPAYRKALVHLAHRARQHHQPPTFPEPEAAPWPLHTAPTATPEAVELVPAGALPASLPAAPAVLEAAPVDSITVHPAPTAAQWTPTAPTETNPTPAESIPESAPDASGNTLPDPVDTTPSTEPEPVAAESAEPSTAVDAATGELSTVDGDDDSEEPAPVRLSEEDAAAEIERCWRERVPLREAGRRATRAPSYVGRVYQRLNSEHSQAA